MSGGADSGEGESVTVARKARLLGPDIVRGLVMVLMALDHSRDYFGDMTVDPVDLDVASPALFLTRWVTHFCAPTFVFLAGAGAFLYGVRGRTKAQVSWFLWTRGLWLLVLEFTVIRFGWLFDWGHPMWLWQVIAGIGAGMVILGVLCRLPALVVGCVGLLIVGGFAWLDSHSGNEWFWVLSTGGNNFPIVPLGDEGSILYVPYPVIPWLGVMCCGYGFGPVFTRGAGVRRLLCAGVGAAALGGFVLLRQAGGYGNDAAFPFVERADGFGTLLSFLNCSKYPPSLCYLLMTLGAALVLLAIVDGGLGFLGRWLAVYGRVPMFYYLLHIYLTHGLALVWHRVSYGEWFSPLGDGWPMLLAGGGFPEWFTSGLVSTYVGWVVVVGLLYFPCRWFGGVKQRRDWKWLSYF